MKLREVIEEFDALVENTEPEAIKVRWISNLDLIINREVLEPRGLHRRHFCGYEIETDMDTDVLAPVGHLQMYCEYMAMQHYRLMHEDANFNRAVNAYNTDYLAYADWVNRHKAAKPTPLRIY